MESVESLKMMIVLISDKILWIVNEDIESASDNEEDVNN